MISSKPKSQKIDQQYLSKIYQQISTKMQILDKLNEEYRNKQQEHFLKTFMGVLEKISQDLQAAQEAYKNIDIEIKKDQQFVLLSGEVSYFKLESFHLSDQLKAQEKETALLKIENDVLQTQIQSLRRAFDVKVREALKLKSQIRVLKNELRILHLDEAFKQRNGSQDQRHLLKMDKKNSLQSYLLEGNPETPRTIAKDFMEIKSKQKYSSRGKGTATPSISKYTLDSESGRKKQFRSARNFYHKKLAHDQNKIDMDNSINQQLKMY